MAAKDSDKKQWTDPKDYGLPFVEITPIRAKAIPIEAIVALPYVDKEVEQEIEKMAPANFEERAEPIVLETPVAVEIKKEAIKPILSISEEKKKPATWVWAVLILGLAMVTFIIWQIQSNSSTSSDIEQPEIAEESSVKEATEAVSLQPESTTADQSQNFVNQDTIQVINNSNPNISKPAETGTTIANTATGNLIRIESKAARPQYFIIVGSLPNEKLAIEEASQYFSNSPELYLISPEEGSRNYRLALSKFGSFRLAADELERIKSQYTEELWILKY